MAKDRQSELDSLRALTHRISSVAPERLPQASSHIACSIWSCRSLLATPPTTKIKNDASVVVHRFTIQLSTLLHHNSLRARWAGIVLVKSAIEAGGLELLNKSSDWVRSLIGLLKKPSPPTIRNLAILTLTRIFMLTWNHANLVREITTPVLPGFIFSCLAIVEGKRCSASELQVVLEAFTRLIPKHPTIFRSSEAQIRNLITEILSTTSTNEACDLHYTSNHRETARTVLILLHHCSPKQSSAARWDETLKAAIKAGHETCGIIFRYVEEIRPVLLHPAISRAKHHPLDTEPECAGQDAAGLAGWSGISAGFERLTELLQLINSHLRLSNSVAVPVRLGQICNLSLRIFSLAGLDVKDNVPSFSTQFARDEVEVLFIMLPELFATNLQVVIAIFECFDCAAIPLVQNIIESITALHHTAQSHADLRAALHNTMATAIGLGGASIFKRDISEIAPLLNMACQDLLPTQTATSVTLAQVFPVESTPVQQRKIADKHLQMQSSTSVERAAKDLICKALSHLNAALIPSKLRARMDRVAVLLRNKELMLASVMNPARRGKELQPQASLLPMLSREFALDLGVEAIIRPRTAPVQMYMSSTEVDEIVMSVELADIDKWSEEEHVHYAVTTDNSTREYIEANTSATGNAAEPTTELISASDVGDKKIYLMHKRGPEENSPSENTVLVKRYRSSSAQVHSPLDDQEVGEAIGSRRDADAAEIRTGLDRSDAIAKNVVESDVSDFEMPPLTLESDSETDDDAADAADATAAA